MGRHSSYTLEEEERIRTLAREEIRLERARKLLIRDLMRYRSRPNILQKIRYYREIFKFIDTEGPNA